MMPEFVPTTDTAEADVIVLACMPVDRSGGYPVGRGASSIMMFFVNALAWGLGITFLILGSLALCIPSFRTMILEDLVTLGQRVSDLIIGDPHDRVMGRRKRSWPKRIVRAHLYRPRHSPRSIVLQAIDRAFL